MGIELAIMESEAQGHQPPGAELTPVADAVTTALAEVTRTNASMTELAATGRELAAKYRGVVADVRTVKGYEQIAAIRTELRKTVRYPLQELQKAGSKMLGTMQRQFNERARELIEEAEGFEAPFQEQLDAEDERKAAEKAERDRLESARVQGHRDALAALTAHVLQAIGETPEQLAARILSVEQVIVDEGWEEFQGQAQQAKDESLRQLNGMLVAARAEAAEREELERERAAQAAWREQQALRERELAEREERLAAAERKQQAEQQALALAVAERAAAVQRRLDAIIALATFPAAPTSEAIRAALAALPTAFTVDLYDGRADEATTLAADTRAHLEGVLAGALAREADEARERRAQQVQVNLNNLQSYGSFTGHESADFFTERLAAIKDEALTEEFYGERATEAALVLAQAREKVEAGLAAAVEREAAQAQAAEQRRQQEAALAAEEALRRRIEDAAPRLYALVRQLAALDDSADAVDLATEAGNLVNEIEGDNNHA